MSRVNDFIKKLKSDRNMLYFPKKFPITLTPYQRQMSNLSKKNQTIQENKNKQNITHAANSISKFLQFSKQTQLTHREKEYMCMYHPQKQAGFQQHDQNNNNTYCSACAIKVIKETNVRLFKINAAINFLKKMQEKQIDCLQKWKTKIINEIESILNKWKEQIKGWYLNNLNKINNDNNHVEVMKFQQGKLLNDKMKLERLLGEFNINNINVQRDKYELQFKSRKQSKNQNQKLISNTLEKIKIEDHSGIDSVTSFPAHNQQIKLRKSLANKRNMSYKNIKLSKKRTITHSNNEIQYQHSNQFIFLH